MADTQIPAQMIRPIPLRWGELPANIWSHELQVQFGDCDPAGIVYTPNFFHMFNVAIEAWYQAALGLSYYDLIRQDRLGIGYVNAHGDFFSPAEMGQVLRFAIQIEHIGTSSFTLILNGFQQDRETVRGRMTVVTTDLDRHRPIPIPEKLKLALQSYRDRLHGTA